jgi:ribonuclease HII
VACCNVAGQVTVNGVPLSEQSYLFTGEAPSQQRFSIVVPPGRLWVMGDHRDISYDSRGHEGFPGGGTIPESAVVGRAFMIIWPPSRWSILNIPATFGQPKLAASNTAASSAAALDTDPLDAAQPVHVQPAWSPLPLALGLGGAVPLTWLQRRVRTRVARRRSRRDAGGSAAEGRSRSVSGLSGANRRRPAVRWRTLRSEMVQHGFTPRRDAGLAAYENVLARAGLTPVAGIDEAGRGACAGPLVVAAVVLDKPGIRKIPGLADSKLLTPEARESAYALITRHAVDWHVVTIPAADIDAQGLHTCNIEGMRRAYAGLRTRAGYVLTDGFPVGGLGSPALAVWKGDQVAASVAAASIVAKVTRDRMMRQLDERYPGYGFSQHKGYVTGEHLRALGEAGPCPEHRRSFRCVPSVLAGTAWTGIPGPGLEGE